MDLHRFTTIVLPIAAVYLVALEAVMERAKLKPGLAVFPTILSLRVLSVLGPVMFLYASYQIGRTAQTHFDYVLTVIMFGFAVLSVYTEQGTISVSDEGIFFRRWYGLRKCSIAWKDVRSAVAMRAVKTITIFSNDGRSIVHTQWHVAPSTFEEVLLPRLKDSFFGGRGRAPGEGKAKNNVCFFFALMVICESRFSTGAGCARRRGWQ